MIAANERHDFLCELVDGILVEKALELRESLLTAWLIRALGDFAQQHGLGVGDYSVYTANSSSACLQTALTRHQSRARSRFHPPETEQLARAAPNSAAL